MLYLCTIIHSKNYTMATLLSEKKIYVEKLSTKAEVIMARDYMEANWTEKMRPEMVRLSLICLNNFKCKLSDLK